MTTTLRNRAIATLSAVAILASAGIGAASAAPGDSTVADIATVQKAPLTPYLQPYAAKMFDTYYETKQQVGGFTYDFLANDDISAGSGINYETLELGQADKNGNMVWFKDKWSSPLMNETYVNGVPFTSMTDDEKASLQKSIQRIYLHDNKAVVQSGEAEGQTATYTIPTVSYRYTDNSGVAHQSTIDFTVISNPDGNATASSDAGTVKPGETVRTAFYANDFAGYAAPVNYPAAFGELQTRVAGTDVWANAMDESKAEQVGSATLYESFTIDGFGSYRFVKDYSAYDAAHPEFFTPIDVAFPNGEVQTVNQFIGEPAEREKAGIFMDFTASATSTGTVPNIEYRFGELSRLGGSDSGAGGSGPVIKTYNYMETRSLVQTDRQPVEKVDTLVLGTCRATIAEQPVWDAAASDMNQNVFKFTVKALDARAWGPTNITAFEVGDVLPLTMDDNAVQDYDPSATIVSNDGGLLTLSYASTGLDRAARLVVQIPTCDFTEAPQEPIRTASSFISIKVEGTVPTVPDEPTPTVPEEPTPVVPPTVETVETERTPEATSTEGGKRPMMDTGVEKTASDDSVNPITVFSLMALIGLSGGAYGFFRKRKTETP